jgi:GH43 family beta-xylosidase
MQLEGIHIRDPFILPVVETNEYYLYGTTCPNCWNGEATGFNCYISDNLTEWSGPYKVFSPRKDFWGTKNYWAPEVYLYNGKYYMFASFKSKDHYRAIDVLIADSPRGIFVPFTDRPLTPVGWECLDGTFYIDDNKPWLVFCHEWTQIVDGKVYAVRLTEDMSKAIGEPIELFSAKESGWSVEVNSKGSCGYITDGPFLYKCQNKLIMLWSSKSKFGYSIGVTYSETNHVIGPWKHSRNLLYSNDGGHGMIFNTFEGSTILVFHTPNKTPKERAVLYECNEKDGLLVLCDKFKH